MPSSLFSRPGALGTNTTSNTSTFPPGDFAFGAQRQPNKLKSISSFFHPFSQTQANTRGSSSLPDSTLSHQDHVIPYQRPRASVDSPLRHRLDGLPYSQSTASLSLRVTLSPTRNQSSPSLISGLPIPMNHQVLGEGISLTSATLQAQMGKQMPTLASAIHIQDNCEDPRPTKKASVTLTTATKSAVTGRQAGPHPLYHMNASSSSLLGSYVHIPAEEIIPVEIKEEEPRGRDRSDSIASQGTIKRRLSRRLSLENIIPKLTGSLRKRERSSSRGGDSGSERRWSITSGFGAPAPNANQDPGFSTSTMGIRTKKSHDLLSKRPLQEVKMNPMAMPAPRNWRSKFNVNKDRQSAANAAVAANAAARAELAVRQAKARSELTDEQHERRGRQLFDERTIKRVPVKNRETVGVLKREREGSGSKLILHRPSSIASSASYPDPAATPKSVPSAHTRPSPTPLPESLTATSLTATLDSPSPAPRPISTPLHRMSVSGLKVPRASASGVGVFSPAQDDMSVLDPAGSPTAIPDASPLIPALTSAGYQSFPALMSKAPGRDGQNEEVTDHELNRRQSRAELKEAFSRMKDISGMEIDSIVSSRQVSGSHQNHPEDHTMARKKAFDFEGLSQALEEASHNTRRHSTAEFGGPPSQDTFGVYPTTRSWDQPNFAPSSSTRTLYTLPRSKSKSATDLSSYVSSKNLVEHLDNTQGPGWWSSDKRLGESRRHSTFEGTDNARGRTGENEVDKDIETLERLAKSTTLPQRAKFDEDEAFGPDSITPSRRSEITSMRPRSFIDLRCSVSSLEPSKRESTTENTIQSSSDTFVPGHGPRQSLVAGSTWRQDQPSPRRTVLARQSMLSVSRNADSSTPTPARLAPHQIPLPLSEPRPNGIGPFISNRISPDIARRASFLNRSNNTAAERDSPSRSVSRQTTRTTLSGSTAPTSLPSDSDEECPHQGSETTINATDSVPAGEKIQAELEAKLSALKARYTLELDAVLGALSISKNENKALKEEISGLTKLLAEGVHERDKLRDCIMVLTSQVEDVPGSGLRRSGSVTSSLLPELAGCISPLREIADSEHISPESPYFDRSAADEFGRRPLPALPRGGGDVQFSGQGTGVGVNRALSTSRKDAPSDDKSTMGLSKGRRVTSVAVSRNVSATGSTCTGESNVLYEPEEEENMDQEGWTLKLREADERYLDDL
ncbi:hypothetical protein I316_03880 [Kwoniella heveanensis BCC8398]|uniref:Uncharacterized protein n=1 Tax=Kwoniella heveanensis BCC8398 TaxID=1296120 RepID=A0A1B9GTL9_9TREE|nr:hypothetical protein I316_03880 [Kwoniella heveanensis BCC8398]